MENIRQYAQYPYSRKYIPSAFQPTRLGDLSKYATQLMGNPMNDLRNNAIIAGLAFSYKNILDDMKTSDKMEQDIRNSGINSQAAFDELYSSYSNDPHMRGFVGRLFPEYYQDYIRRLDQ